MNQRPLLQVRKGRFSVAARLLLWGLMLALASCGASKVAPPKAQAGKIDLSAWDFARDGIVPLNGEWKMYRGQLLSPEQVDQASVPDGYFNFPGSWNDWKKDGKAVGAEGFATFSLDVILPDASQLWGLKSRSVNTAWKVWVDGRLLGGAGTVGQDVQSMVPASLPRIFAFQPQGNSIRLTIQVSNFYHRKGGFWWPLQLGLHDQIHAARESGLAIDLFLLGALLIMGFYHFGLFLLRPKDTSPLFFGIFCLLVGSRMLFINENFSAALLPWLSWMVAKKTEYAITFLLTPFFFLFLNQLYPKEFRLSHARILGGFNGLLVLFAILAPAPLFTLTPTIFNWASMAVFCYALVAMALTILRRREYALPIFLGTLILVLSTVNDMLNDSEVLRTGFFAPLGLFIFIFIQSYILSKRFSNAYQLAEVYAKTFQMFVPRQFLDRIAKKGIGSIKLGNAEQDNVTILFSDIRSFTTISEALTPDGVLAFLNSFLSRMEPPIREQGGFVDKYLGDAIMALFDSSHSANGANSALNAALGMQAALRQYNGERAKAGLAAIVSGIGLHSGSVIIGTIGGSERMDSTAIGDAVNLASRIEGLTKLYKLDILASDETVNAPGAMEQFLIRFVDRVRVVGKSVPVGVWEVVGKRREEQNATFERLLPTYESALQKYFAMDFQGAMAELKAFQAELPHDHVVQMYLDRCTQFIAAPPVAGWSGVIDIGVK